MKKLILTIALLTAITTTPVFAAEVEESTAVVAETVNATPRFTIPKLPQVSRITIKPKFNFNIDFSKYIPRI